MTPATDHSHEAPACALPHAPAGSYAGDITPQEAWARLTSDANTMLVDVRTLPEWQFTGTPDGRGAKGKVVAVSWKFYPNFTLNPEFSSQLKVAGATPDMHIFFLCRSGGRSTDAAIAMTAEGFKHCYNVSGGFEGHQNEHGHRGTVDGWKAARLPWGQS